MDATPIDFASPRPAGDMLTASGRLLLSQAGTSAMAVRWAALHDASAVVATLAGVAEEPLPQAIASFPAAMRETGGSRCAMAEQGIEDLAAMMEPGLTALLAIHARGGDTAAPALALWQEFDRARNALLALMPAPETQGRLRSA